MADSTQIAELLQRGIAAAKAGRKEDAYQTLLRVTELDERNERAWLWLSGVVESFEDRRICLENVLAINPGNAHARAGLQWLDQHAPVPTVMQERCPLCQLPVSPSGTTCSRCGQVLVVVCPGCGQYVDVTEASCPECGQTLGDFRGGARYHLALARAYLEHQRHALAEEAVTRAEAEAAGDPEIRKGVAALHEEMGHTDLAIAAYERALKSEPENAALYASLGAIYQRRSISAKAREMYEQAAERAGDDPAILVELAQLYIEDGATPEALRLLERVVQLNPEHAQAQLLLGNVYLDRGQKVRAIDRYKQACQLTTLDSPVGQEARRKLGKLRPAVPQQAQGWGETLRRMGGLMLSPALAALVNATLIPPWKVSLIALGALATAGVGAYLWTCATDVPRNPVMRRVFGKAGVDRFWQKALVGVPGFLLWAGALGLILWKV